MKRLFILLVLVVIGAVGSATLPSTALSSGGGLPDNWPPLLNCPDVNGDGPVTTGDVLQVVNHFGTHVVKDNDGHFVPDDDYMLLYDIDGGGQVAASDVFRVILAFGDSCPLVETQVAQATLATMKYRDWNVAAANGYIQATPYVPNMGIHVTNNQYTTTFDHENPIGMIYKQAPGGGPQELIGMWYVIPIPEVCAAFGVPDAQNCPTGEPEGFDGPEDNMDMSSVQRGWHQHSGLCIWNPGTPNAGTAENVSQDVCENNLNGLWFSTYGWMVHLYNFMPNNTGRFMMWAYDTLP